MKYKLTSEFKIYFGIKLYQIEALKDFGNVKKGDKGGWIEKEENLEQSGNAWVYGDAQVYGDARVSGNALVYGNAQVSGNAWVYGNAQVYGDAQVSGNAWVYGDARVSGNALVYGNAQVSGNARVYGDARVSGNALVYGDAWVSLKASFIKGWFIGGDDTGKITDITDKTGSTYWKNQYVLGDYEITPIEDEKKEIETIEIGGIKYSKSEVEAKLKDIKPI
jgi:carbonic anhydrase/acetyltransferase-like protein (isoleucine patch superfamily)